MAERLNSAQVIAKMQRIVEVLSKMDESTRKLQQAMRAQEDAIRGDKIMAKAMENLEEINRTVKKMKTEAEKVADSIEEGARDIIRIQKQGANEIEALRR